jgi:hypothetical protein
VNDDALVVGVCLTEERQNGLVEGGGTHHMEIQHRRMTNLVRTECVRVLGEEVGVPVKFTVEKTADTVNVVSSKERNPVVNRLVGRPAR